MSKALKKNTFRVVNSIFLAALAAICLLPIIHIVAVSFSDQAAVSANQVGRWQKEALSGRPSEYLWKG